ncbi:hypothetical protein GOODEAATRI_032095 [Goodea atripinnis]|uniref:NADH dehydrogenase subunit 6 n=1 Tax=Goodea atripinnis TaxID=208336 RepID=A0ABV0NGY2_9TELE
MFFSLVAVILVILIRLASWFILVFSYLCYSSGFICVPALLCYLAFLLQLLCILPATSCSIYLLISLSSSLVISPPCPCIYTLWFSLLTTGSYCLSCLNCLPPSSMSDILLVFHVLACKSTSFDF